MENTNNIQQPQQQLQNNCEEKYNGWLVSNSLVKRSLAVFGHYVLGYLIIMAVFMLFFVALALVVGGISALLGH